LASHPPSRGRRTLGKPFWTPGNAEDARRTLDQDFPTRGQSQLGSDCILIL
jgi:hypothetical protein